MCIECGGECVQAACDEVSAGGVRKGASPPLSSDPAEIETSAHMVIASHLALHAITKCRRSSQKCPWMVSISLSLTERCPGFM